MAPPAEDGADWKDQNGEAADLAQTYRDLVRGEQAAAALEASLTTLESKLDAMLEALEDKADASSPAADETSPATDTKIEDKPQANTSGNEKPAGHGSSKTAE